MNRIAPSSAAGLLSPSPEESSRVLEEAAKRGMRNVGCVSDLVGANELEEKTIARFEALIRHGCKFVDLVVRKDGQEYRFEADWLARLFRAEKL